MIKVITIYDFSAVGVLLAGSFVFINFLPYNSAQLCIVMYVFNVHTIKAYNFECR